MATERPTSQAAEVITLPTAVADLCRAQAGTISRSQLLGTGLTRGEIRSLLGRRLLGRVHQGVYVDHTGTPTPEQLAWAAVLWARPGALGGRSALDAAGLGQSTPARRTDVTVLVAAGRHLAPPAGVTLRRTRHLDSEVEWHRHPPRQRLEQAVLDVASAARDDDAATAVLAEAVSSRRTTAARLLEVLEARDRLPRRRFLRSVLADVADGSCSVLERSYLRLVERAHGLPSAGRQVRSTRRGTVYRDVEYTAYGVVVELDGRLHHEHAADRDRDLDRDLAAATLGLLTIRLWWGQVLGRPCRTAAAIADVLRQRGWPGEIQSCPRCPTAARDRGR